MTDPLLLTEEEAAERLRLCSRTLRRERQAGRLPYILIGRAVRYTLDDLQAFVDSSRQDIICAVGNMGATSDHKPTAKRWKEESPANAILIKAAPDLYEAAAEMVAVGWFVGAQVEAAEKLKLALAKASTALKDMK